MPDPTTTSPGQELATTGSPISNYTAEKGLQELSAVLEEPPPNGGFRAWLQVLSAFCIFLNTW